MPGSLRLLHWRVESANVRHRHSSAEQLHEIDRSSDIVEQVGEDRKEGGSCSFALPDSAYYQN